jgi:hypothetical protein
MEMLSGELLRIKVTAVLRLARSSPNTIQDILKKRQTHHILHSYGRGACKDYCVSSFFAPSFDAVSPFPFAG